MDDNSCPQLFQDFCWELFIRVFLKKQQHTHKKKTESHSFLRHLVFSLPWLDLFSEQEKSELDVETSQLQRQRMSVEISKGTCKAHCDCKRKERIFKIDLFCPFPPHKDFLSIFVVLSKAGELVQDS